MSRGERTGLSHKLYSEEGVNGDLGVRSSRSAEQPTHGPAGPRVVGLHKSLLSENSNSINFQPGLMSKDWTAVELKQNYDLIYVQKAQSKLYAFAS